MKNTYIIAEAGVNHNGDIKIAKELILSAKKAGANCIKFQTYKTENLITPESPKALYQLKTTNKGESQFKMLKDLELDYLDFKVLFNFCKEVEIDFISTPYNFEDVDFLDNLGVDCFKIASGQLTEIPFLRYVAKKNKKIILSTGMSNLAEIIEAVDTIKKYSKKKLIVLQCTTNYPSKVEEANLKCLKTIKDSCNVTVGYSDHVIGNYACFSAVALGAKVIEKHFTLDKSMKGPDHICSSDPIEFKELVLGIRSVEKSLGSSAKRPSSSEIKNEYGMKRSIVAKKKIKKGEILSDKNLTFKRPKNGLEVNLFDSLLGKKVNQNIEENEIIRFENINW